MKRLVSLAIGVLCAGGSDGAGADTFAQTDPATTEASSVAPAEAEPASFWQREWYEQRGIQLPRQFGVALNLVYMERDIEVTDVTVKLASRPPESIADRARFDVANRTSLTMVRLDAWVLPFLDLYVMGGQTRTDTSVRASFAVSPPLGDPIPVVVEQNQRVDGPLYGGGMTLVGGHGAFFVMLDGNYARSDLELFDGTVDALLLSARIGWHRDTGLGQWRVWTGVLFLDSNRTLTISDEHPLLGLIEVEVEQRPVHPTTLEVGGSLTIERRWEFLVEVGSNFDDAFLTVVSAGYRF
jgi:hypothetical protein